MNATNSMHWACFQSGVDSCAKCPPGDTNCAYAGVTGIYKENVALQYKKD